MWIEDSGVGLTQFVPAADGTFTPHPTELTVADRPPVASLLQER